MNNSQQLELDISFGKSRTANVWKTDYLTWGEFVERLRDVRRTNESMAQYDKMDKAQKGNVKDGPAFVGGLVIGGHRKKENINSRSLITLDADNVDDSFLYIVDLMIGGTAYAIYSTHSHRPVQPKYRLIVPSDRSMSPDECSAASRKLAEIIGMKYFDKTTFDVNRLMYMPSCSKDAEPVFVESQGPPISIDKLLGAYSDWADPSQWPRHPNEVALQTNGKKAQDPRQKLGQVGLICRAFTLEEGIDTFLSDVYTPGTMPNRYTYAGGSSGNGLEVFPDQELAFSHQDSDPVANGRTHNLFDLVRIHKYRHLDDGIDESTAIDKRPSYEAMINFTEGLDEVKSLSQRESSAEIQAAFGNESFDDNPESGEKSIDITNVLIPTGFKVMNGKIFEVKELKNDTRYVPVCDCMVAITSRYLNLTDQTHGLVVAWKSADWVRTVSDSRSTFMDSKKIINLSDYGLPVHSANARNLAAYLSRFESENEANLTSKLVSNQLGWVKGGFLLGDKFIGKNEIEFQPKDGGDGQTAKGFHSKGTLKGTLDILQTIKPFVPVKMTIYAALSAPVLECWGEGSYIFELAGGTSRGKTTALRIAASLFGCPDEQKPGFFKQWNLTKVSIERYAATMNNLPLFIDDTKKSDPRIVPGVIYQFCSGQSKGRGSLRGTQSGAGWCTAMLSTGEQKLTSFAKDGGAAGRVLSLEGSPFSATDIDMARVIDGLNKQASDHYGHMAEPWIQYLQTTDMKHWKRQYALSQEKFLEIARGAGEVAMRLSKMMALNDVVGQMFDNCFGLDLYASNELLSEWNKVTQGATELDRAAEARDAVMGWVASRARQFVRNGASPLGSDTLGIIKRDEIIVIDDVLDKYLESSGYEPRSISKAWKERGWLKTSDGRTKKRVRINGGNPWTYCFDLTDMGWSYEIHDQFEEFTKV